MDAPPANAAAKKRILLAEDERTVRVALTALLSDAGYDVDAASDGADAIARFSRVRPDAALLDVMMPKADGHAVLAAIRAAAPSLPVLFLTAYDSEEEELRALGLGADDFISKSASPALILARLSTSLRRSSQMTNGKCQITNSPSPNLSAPLRLCVKKSPPSSPHAAPPLPPPSFSFSSAIVDPLALRLFPTPASSSVALTEREVAMLRFFAAHPGEAMNADALLTRFWGADFDGGDAALRMAVARLRAKLGPAAPALKNVYGVGYAYDPPPLVGRVARMLAHPTGFASRNLPSDSRGALRLLRSSRFALTRPDRFAAGASRSSTAHPNAPSQKTPLHMVGRVAPNAPHTPTRAVVSLGSNLGDRAANLASALAALSALPETRLEKASGVIETAPVDVPAEFAALKFLNQVAIFQTRLAPLDFSRRMHAIEDAMGRVRTVRNGPRVIDIDLIDFGGLVMDTPELTLPHPRAATRPFVQIPLKEIS